ncbi:thiamine phosphate synthase [Pedobacter sp. L105]|uniref:thiamine phosphate synthase n=1 Tax=Pedobacter sp. L105 TaxID=1641871 RepID=UPI00131C5975|nr:thiamine phosphate synthase [Pedobacter sp. L105]
MELIVVTLPEYFEGEGPLINELFTAGLHLLHLRKPDNDEEQFRKLLMDIQPEYHPAIAIHQHHELAEEFSLRRLHFTEQHRKLMSIAKLDELRGQGFCLSSSVHHLEELPDLDYVFYGPVFNSISKAGYNTVLESGFVLPPHAEKIFAIGGVNAGRLKQLSAMNFDGAAVLGALWHQEGSPVAEFKKIKQALTDLQ